MSKRMRNAVVAGGIILSALIVTHSYHPIPNVPRLPQLQSPFKSDPAGTTTQLDELSNDIHDVIPKRIWQTWRDTPQKLDDDYRGWTSSWTEKNPGYRYELLTDSTALSFVETMFYKRPDIIDTFLRTEDIILRADYTRYLALLADGGTYADMDTDCTRPIDTWIPDEYKDRVGFVVGVEYDAMDDNIRSDFEDRVQLCQWAFMSKPGNRILAHVVDRVTKALQGLAPDGGAIAADGNNDVLHITGPRIFSHAIFEALSSQMGTNITEDDVTKLQEPKLIGDVLILPINAFGSGQMHSNSKEQNNDEQLLWHHFNGFWGWKDAHDGKKDREKEAAEHAAKEAEKLNNKARPTRKSRPNRIS